MSQHGGRIVPGMQQALGRCRLQEGRALGCDSPAPGFSDSSVVCPGRPGAGREGEPRGLPLRPQPDRLPHVHLLESSRMAMDLCRFKVGAGGGTWESRSLPDPGRREKVPGQVLDQE